MKELLAKLVAGYHEQNEVTASLLARIWILEQQVDDVEARESYQKEAEDKALALLSKTWTMHQEMQSLLASIQD